MSVPTELKELRQWVVWRAEVRDGKETKVPYQPGAPTRKAATNDPSTWGTGEEALAALTTDSTLDGVGFVFTEGDPYCGVDLDKCRNPKTEALEPWAEKRLEELDSYAEVSPSGTGVHVIAKARLDGGGRKRDGVEVYDRGRYFTVTGQSLNGSVIAERQAVVTALYAALAPPGQEQAEALPAEPVDLEDRELLELARDAHNGPKFTLLYDDGDWQGAGYDSQSSADQALCNQLAFWTGRDARRMDRLFRASALMRPKWDQRARPGETYGAGTITRACAFTTETYTPPSSGARGGEQVDEDGFWTSRASLTHVRDFARARMCSPWAMLGVVLARVIAATPYRITLPPIVGGRGSLNLAVGLVGRPGAGKGAAEAAAREAVLMPSTFKMHKLGSGQGLAHGYAAWEKVSGESQLVRHADSCLFVMQEVDHLGGLSSQQGSTLLPELRSALMGEQLGHLYVDKSKRIEVPGHTYRLALTVGIQPARAAVLFDDADGGTPQRFVWLPTDDPEAPEDPGKPPMPLNWREPEWPVGHVLGVCAVAREAIVAARQAELRGAGRPLDGHRLLLREKVAAALDILDGEAEVSEAAWDLAGVVLAVSDRTRSACLEAIAEGKRERNQARGLADGERAVMVEEAVRTAAVARVSAHILRQLEDGEWHAHADLRRTLASRDREYFEPAIEALARTGQIKTDESERGMRYRRA